MRKMFITYCFFVIAIFTFLFLPFSTDAAVNPNDSKWIKNLSRLSSENDTVLDFAPQIAISGPEFIS